VAHTPAYFSGLIARFHAMKQLGTLFTSSIGRKFLMAVTGLVLVGFETGHLVGNLQIFAHPDKINGYAHFLQSLGPALWGIRLFLLACVVVHGWAAVTLWLESTAARGPEDYVAPQWLQALWASRYMRHTGFVVGAFLIYHLAHFTVGVNRGFFVGEGFKTRLDAYTMAADFHLLGMPLVAKGQDVHDVYSMVFLGFSHPCVAIFYIVAVGLLSLHLWHGADSMFQTLGVRNATWSTGLRRLVVAFSLAYFLGSLAIPGAIATGLVKPAAGTVAVEKMGCACCADQVSPETKK
jgi:succinate dehydrogenase / fumarate reductase cytochrome b subunit